VGLVPEEGGGKEEEDKRRAIGKGPWTAVNFLFDGSDLVDLDQMCENIFCFEMTWRLT
jgi:hypothetical protein